MPSLEDYIASPKPTLTLIGEARVAISRVQGTKIKGAIHADKLLLALLEFAVGEKGKRHTAAVILAAGNDKSAILEAARTWLDHLLFPFKAAAIERIMDLSGENTPTDDDDDCLPTNFKKPIDEEEIALGKLVEQRDGRCAITGTLGSSNAVIPTGRATHILPHTLHAFNHDRIEKNGAQQKISARSWDVIKNWGSLDVQDLVRGPTNAIALRMDLSLTFRHFLWWLKPIPEDPNTYIIKSNLGKFPYSNKRLTFMDHSDGNQLIPLPDPRIIRLHTALANVLHASGAAAYFDRVWSTAEKSGVLSEDGSSDIGALLSALAM